MRYRATVELYIDLDPQWATGGDVEGALADGISATMQNAIENPFNDLRLIDWGYTREGDGYSYAKPFEGQTPEEALQDSYSADSDTLQGDAD